MTGGRADVVIVGGGVVGMSVAYHIARRAKLQLVVIEREVVGAGATGRASGGIRQQFHRAVEVQMCRESVRFWEGFEALSGIDFHYRQIGYLYLLTTSAEVRQYRRDVAMQNRLGVPSRMLEPPEIAGLFPGLNLDGVLAGCICPKDGHASPEKAVQGLAAEVRRLGVRIIEGKEVTGISLEGDTVRAIEAGSGSIATPVVVNAAGPDADRVAAMAGLELPITVRRMNQYVSHAVPGLPEGAPIVVEPSTTLFMAPLGDGVLLGMNRQDEAETEAHIDWDFLPKVLSTARGRLPSIPGPRMRTAWAGRIEMSPDRVPIIGPAVEVEGYFHANGMSGHGFMMAPAVGRILADLILDGDAPDVDLSQLSAARFSRKGAV